MIRKIHNELLKMLAEGVEMLAEKLKAGDIIGVIAPDKALKSKDKEYLENATKYFESLGL